MDTAIEVNNFAPKTTSPTSTTTISTTKTFAWDGCKFTTLGFIQNGSARECFFLTENAQILGLAPDIQWRLARCFLYTVLSFKLNSGLPYMFFLQSKVSFDRRSHARKREAAQQSTGSMGRATVAATAFSGLGLFLSDTCKARQGLEGLLAH